MSETASTQPAGTGVVIVAAGSGTRLGHGMPKALVHLAGRTLLEHCLDAVAASGIATRIVVVLPPGNRDLLDTCTRFTQGTGMAVETVEGGATRTDSVHAGLSALQGTRRVLVHDAARCLTPPAVFLRVAAELEAGAVAVIPGVTVTDTIKTVDPGVPAPGGAGADTAVVTGTPHRAGLRAIQTPQGFDLAALAAAHREARGWPPDRSAAFTDDAGLMEATGHRVLVVPGSDEAFKITTPLDLLLAEALLARGTGHDMTEEQA